MKAHHIKALLQGLANENDVGVSSDYNSLLRTRQPQARQGSDKADFPLANFFVRSDIDGF